jgi:hypothetical protein
MGVVAQNRKMYGGAHRYLVNTPFVILLILAGLQSLPKSSFESAKIDGGSAWFTFRNLTLPMLKPFSSRRDFPADGGGSWIQPSPSRDKGGPGNAC